MKSKFTSFAYGFRPAPPLLAALLIATTLVAAPATGDSPADFPYAVPFELGDAEFGPGDSITISEVRGTRDLITTNETYCVSGTYTLASRDKARLAFFATTRNSGPTPVDPRQTTEITKGTGSFRLVKTMDTDGYLHLSFYPHGSGSDFGGVYFGQGEWVLRKKTWSSTAQHAGSAGPNQAIYEYLGSPVPVPAKLDSAYSRQGLVQAVQTAAQNAGVTLKRIEVDDSEFPFVIGVICGEGELEKVAGELKKMPGYEYPGSVSSSTCAVFNIVPWSVFPSESSLRIGHRLGVREQVLFDKLLAMQ
jgi:hypothetical protein